MPKAGCIFIFIAFIYVEVTKFAVLGGPAESSAGFPDSLVGVLGFWEKTIGLRTMTVYFSVWGNKELSLLFENKMTGIWLT